MKTLPTKLKVLNIIMLVAGIPLLFLLAMASYYTLVGHDLFVSQLGVSISKLYSVIQVITKDEATLESYRFIFMTGTILTSITFVVAAVLRNKFMYELLGYKLIKPRKTAYEKQQDEVRKAKEKQAKELAKQQKALAKEEAKKEVEETETEDAVVKSSTPQTSADIVAQKLNRFKK